MSDIALSSQSRFWMNIFPMKRQLSLIEIFEFNTIYFLFVNEILQLLKQDICIIAEGKPGSKV